MENDKFKVKDKNGKNQMYFVGQTFLKRIDLSAAGIHPPPMSGIFGSPVAQSIVISGGYEDDVDNGDEIIYTGSGGQENGRQVANQELKLGNSWLCKAFEKKASVRVTRGYNLFSQYAPREGYRYDGLYKITEHWKEKGSSGFVVYRFKLERNPGQPPLPDPIPLDKIKKKKSIPLKPKNPKKPRLKRNQCNDSFSENSISEDEFEKNFALSECPKENIPNSDICLYCGINLSKLSEIIKIIEHFENHKLSYIRRLSQEERFTLNLRNYLNQGRIRSIIEFVEGSFDYESSDEDECLIIQGTEENLFSNEVSTDPELITC